MSFLKDVSRRFNNGEQLKRFCVFDEIGDAEVKVSFTYHHLSQPLICYTKLGLNFDHFIVQHLAHPEGIS